MKKALLILLILFSTAVSFALPNLKLYKNGEFAYFIENNRVYDDKGDLIYYIEETKFYYADDDECGGIIEEKDDKLFIDFLISDNTLFWHYEYSITSGFLLFEKNLLGTTIEYDDKTGLSMKTSYYMGDLLISYELYEYDKKQLKKTIFYDYNNTVTHFLLYEYDKKSGRKIRVSDYNGNNQLSTVTEYDSNTGKIISYKTYYEDGSLKTQTSYTKETQKATEKLVYSSNSKKPEKFTYIQFDEDGFYQLNDDYNLNSNFCWYSQLEEFAEKSKEEPINWNERYNATVRKYNFTKSDSGYEVINNLIKNRYLSEFSFTLSCKNSLFFYTFTTNESDEIDLSSCYEIRLTKKQQDYSSMNKSGKGKGPFGFDIGMTYEDIKNACGGKEPEHIADDRYFVKPKKSHPLFEKYIVWISDSFGLCYIKGLSYNIHTSNYGTEVKSKFNDLLRTLENKYGKFTLTDTIKKDYSWKDDKYFMESIQDGARTYIATLNIPNEKIYDFDGICWIGIGIDCVNKYSTDEAYIWLEYEFLNYDDAQEALNDVL